VKWLVVIASTYVSLLGSSYHSNKPWLHATLSSVGGLWLSLSDVDIEWFSTEKTAIQLGKTLLTWDYFQVRYDISYDFWILDFCLVGITATVYANLWVLWHPLATEDTTHAQLLTVHNSWKNMYISRGLPDCRICFAQKMDTVGIRVAEWRVTPINFII